MVLKSSFDPKIVWQLPEVRFLTNLMMFQKEQNIRCSLPKQTDCIIIFKVAIRHSHRIKRKHVCSVAKSLHPSEAEILVAAKDGLHIRCIRDCLIM